MTHILPNKKLWFILYIILKNSNGRHLLSKQKLWIILCNILNKSNGRHILSKHTNYGLLFILS